MLAADAPDIWRWHAHPEVWVLVLCIVGLGVYAERVIGPKVVRDGSPIVTRSQKRFFVAAVLVLWASADWPVHDIAERYLYSVHMYQHLLVSMVAAPLFLLATPTWLARLIVGDGWVGGKALRWLCHPVVAGVIFNAFFVFTHWQPVVNNSVQYAALHYTLHVILFFTALLMWMPVCGPLPELRISLPARMVYLFCMSIVPTVPSAWLIFAEHPIYSAYDHGYTIWGMTPTDDQQTAGVLMKLGAGVYLWVLIAVLFARWAKQNMAEDSGAVKVTRTKVEGGDDILTWDDVALQLEHAGPAPVERAP